MTFPAPTPARGPAFYATPKLLRRARLREWWTLLHPPYTMMHLSFVVIGACLVNPVSTVRLVITLLAFFLAVGIGAHSLDELHGRPLSTTIPTWQLVVAACTGLGGALALGVAGIFIVSPYLSVFIVVGLTMALGYNLELFSARLHTDWVFVSGWGAFPLLTSYFAQHANLSAGAVAASLFAALLAGCQRHLSTPARDIRRRCLSVNGEVVLFDGTRFPLGPNTLLAPLEKALRALCWATMTLAVALVFERLAAH